MTFYTLVNKDNYNVYCSENFMNVFEYYLNDFEKYISYTIVKSNKLNEIVLGNIVIPFLYINLENVKDYLKSNVKDEKGFIKSTRIIHNHIKEVNEWYEKRNSYKKVSDQHRFEENNYFPELHV